MVQVAGTNGKGSVCGMLAGLLQGQGLKVGLYTSPHLFRYEERIVVDGKIVGPDVLKRALARIDVVLEDDLDILGNELIPTEFEMGTILASLVFADMEVDVAVMETGLGGRLDAVTALDSGFQVITAMGIDHQEFLGVDPVGQAREKAAVIRPDSHVVVDGMSVRDDVRDVFVEACVRMGCEIHLVPEIHPLLEGMDLPSFTRRNISIALASVSDMLGRPVNELMEGLETDKIRAMLPRGRMDRIEWEGLDIRLDVAHNPLGARAIVEEMGSGGVGGGGGNVDGNGGESREGVGNDGRRSDPPTIILGMLEGKDHLGFLDAIRGLSPSMMICVSLDSPRGWDATASRQSLLEHLGGGFGDGIPILISMGSVGEALDTLREERTVHIGPVLVTGSHATVRDAIRHMEGHEGMDPSQ